MKYLMGIAFCAALISCSEVKKESAEYSDYIALFGSIAKQNLSEFQAKPGDSETLPSIIKEEKVDSSCS